LGTRYAGKWVARLAKFDPKTLWRDAGVGLTGPAVRQYIRCFARAWRHAQTGGPVRQTFFAGNLRLPRPAKGRRFGKARHYDPPRADEPADVLAPGHGHGLLAIAPSFMSVLRPALRLMFATCRRRAWLTMAYFAPDDGLIEAMCAAARRGVDVRLMLPQRGDPKVLAWAAQSFYSTLMAAGVRVFERREALLHQKSIVFDGNLTIIGSTNLDYRSIELNLESSAILQSPALARQMEQLFEHDMAFATEIDSATWRQRPLIDKFVQAVIYRVRYLL
jgi:cardiolipin synthase